MKGLVKAIRANLSKTTGPGFVKEVIGLAKDKRAEYNSRQSMLKSQKKLAQSRSKTSEAIFEKGEWKPYEYGK